ncbi:ferritin-like domain-containing protein [bacterium]|jgi:bacterioferritin|nr:ferritin-like domain-containing protein [bacterium]MBT4495321.1 ferritin-like domain-containing protein [bacterium]MBT4763761.1 ferritin-like domain-containing protein [bacterium]MBT5401131.1 ferritin-like domain-containing protein [bacterium]MBT5942909.1 ferritin-like domain-containing protein [bacterium]
MEKEELIKLLNEDLAKEFAAAVQYIQHAATITGAKYQSIQKELVIHATEEMEHANQLAIQIDFLGGVPTTDVDTRYTSDDSEEMLKQDLTGEKGAIARYKTRVKQANELGEYGLENVLKNILSMEEEHQQDLETALND